MSQLFGAATEAEARTLVRDQLSRILASPLFSNSKRFPAFLRFTVEHALTSTDTLKERTIGAEAFGREPGYDTSQDPIVRMAAAEVRKRLVQYYQEPEHANELQISYQPGSYLPEFSFGPSVSSPEPEISVPAPPSASSRRDRRTAAIWIIIIAALAVGVGALALWPRSGAPARSPLGRFWEPILGSSAPVLLCIGDPFSPGQQGANAVAPQLENQTIAEFLQLNSVRFTDSVTLAMIAGELRAQAKPFRIRRPASTDLKDLREGPVILIGGFNNPWTVRISEGLRFTLSGDERGRYILDRDRPDDRQWNTGGLASTKLKDLTKTYGLITRVKDPATGSWVMMVSGLVLGTRAAAECVLDADCLARAESATSGWDQRNVQIVVSAAVVGEDSGAPTVVVTHVW